MSLLDEFQAQLATDENLSAGDFEVLIPDARLVSDEFVDSLRWVEVWTAVFKRGNEYVGLDYQVPSSEYQEGSEGESEVYVVRPVEVTVTKYEKV